MTHFPVYYALFVRFLLFSSTDSGKDIILIEETSQNKKNKKKNAKTTISLYKLKKTIFKEQNNQNEHSLSFEFDIFNDFFNETHINYIDLNEKKQNIYLIDNKNVLTCFDILNNKYVLKYPFFEQVNSFSVNPTNNLFAISFPNKE